MLISNELRALIVVLIFAFVLVYFLDKKSSKINSKQDNTCTNLIDTAITIPTTYFDLTVKELGSKRVMFLAGQELPDVPVCNTKVGDTIRLCKPYGKKDWHIEQYHNQYGSEVDHCEDMTDGRIISINGIYTK